MAIRDCVLAVGAGVFDSRGRPTPGTGAAYNLLGFYRALDGLRVRRGQASTAEAGASSGSAQARPDDELRRKPGMTDENQFPVCSSPNRSQVLPLKRMNCIWSTGT